jgi:hypothetical protein
MLTRQSEAMNIFHQTNEITFAEFQIPHEGIPTFTQWWGLHG